MNIVLTLDEVSLKKLTDKFAKNQLPTKNSYIRFFAKVGSTSISVYSSKKVVFQGLGAETLASQFGYKKVSISAKQTNLIGTDEVGNGSYFGSLVVVASYISREMLPLLKKLGVDDSKKLTDDKINAIAPRLIEEIPHCALVVEPNKYNEVISKGYNAVSIKVSLHNQAIFLLEKKLSISPEFVIIDAFTTKNNYEKYVKKEKNQLSSNVTLIPKAESQFLAVACSSVIARHLFLKNLRQLSQRSGYSLPSGAGAASDRIAAAMIRENGIKSLEDFAKLHFANTQKAANLADERK